MMPLAPYKPARYPPTVGNFVPLASKKLKWHLDKAHKYAKDATDLYFEAAVERNKDFMRREQQRLAQAMG